jgi:hypothetical protein
MPDLPILRELGDDLHAAFRAAESHPARRALSRRARLACAVGAVAAVLAVLFAALPAGDRPAPSVRALDALAATAAKQPSTVPEAGEYTYLKVRSGADTSRERSRRTTEWWIAADGSGRVLQRSYIGNDFESPSDNLPTRWRRVGGGWWQRDVRFGPGEFSRVHRVVAPGVLDLDVEALPTDPGDLEQVLRRTLREAAADADPETGFHDGARPTAQHLLTVIEQTLAHPLAPPALRSALYRVAARLDGVEVTEGAKDPIGRRATALTLEARLRGGSRRLEVFFDPATSAALGRRDVSGWRQPAPSATPPPPGETPAPVPPGSSGTTSTLTDFSVYTRPVAVESIHERP